MTESKKGKPQLSPTRRGGPSFDDGDGKDVFPEFPPFFVDIHGLLKDDRLVKDYEREYLYELERTRVLQIKEQLAASASLNSLEKKRYARGEAELFQSRENGYTDNFDDVILHRQGEGASELKSDISIDVPAEQFSKYKDPFASYYMTDNFASASWVNYHHKSVEAFELLQKNDIEEEKAALELERIELQQDEISENASFSTTPPPPRGERDKSAKIIKEFHHLFPSYDIIVRESEEISAISLFCEAIAKDIVNRGAELYVSRCFESIKEGYTAHSVWEELRDSVACSFLPQDVETSLHSCKPLPPSCSCSLVNHNESGIGVTRCHEKACKSSPNTHSSSTLPSTAFLGCFGDCIDCENRSCDGRHKKLVHIDHYLGQDAPSSLLLSAPYKLKLSSSQSLSLPEYHQRSEKCNATHNIQGLGPLDGNKHIDPASLSADDAPLSVPIDEYCRYVVPVVSPSTMISQPSYISPPGFIEGARAPILSSEPREPATLVANVKVEKEITEQPRPSFQVQKRLRRISQGRKKSSSSVYGGEALVVDPKQEDNLTAALKKVPQTYFSKPPSMANDSVQTEMMEGHHNSRKSSIHAAHYAADQQKVNVERVGSPAPLFSSLPGTKSASRKSKPEKNISLVNIEKDRVLLARDLSDLLKNAGVHKKGTAMRRESVGESCSANCGPFVSGGDGRRVVSFEIKLPDVVSPATPENVAQPPSQRSPARRLLPEETRKIKERKQWRELEEQREREKLFVLPLHQPEEIQNHVDVKPEPGVQVQCFPSSTMPGVVHSHSRAYSVKDEPVVLADGGDYIIPENKQRWLNDTRKPKTTSTRKKEGETQTGDATKKINTILSSAGGVGKGPLISAHKEPQLPLVNDGKKGERSVRPLQGTAPKIMRSSRFPMADKAANFNKVVVAHSAAHVSRDQVRLLPTITPSSRENPVKRTKQTSVIERERVDIVASALAHLSST